MINSKQIIFKWCSCYLIWMPPILIIEIDQNHFQKTINYNINFTTLCINDGKSQGASQDDKNYQVIVDIHLAYSQDLNLSVVLPYPAGALMRISLRSQSWFRCSNRWGCLTKSSSSRSTFNLVSIKGAVYSISGNLLSWPDYTMLSFYSTCLDLRRFKFYFWLISGKLGMGSEPK